MDLTLLLPLMLIVTGSAAPGAAPAASPLAHTYSIVARDPVTGEMGVAVQSHYFSVGPIVPWAEAGVGAVATQSLVLVDYGPKGLELMRQGLTAFSRSAARTWPRVSHTSTSESISIADQPLPGALSSPKRGARMART